MSENNITVPRVTRIQGILLKDPTLKQHLKGKKDYPIKSRDDKTVLFHAEAVQVVQAVHAAGMDAYAVSKSEVLKIGSKVLIEDAAAKPAKQASAAAAPSTGARPVNYSIPLMSLISSAHQIAEHDETKGAPDRQKKIKSLLEEYSEMASSTL